MTFRGLCLGVTCSMTAQVGNLRAMGARIQVGIDLSYHSPMISHENIWMPGSIVLVILIMIQKLFCIAWFYPELADCVFFGSSGKTMWISLQSSCYLMVIKPLSKPWLFTIIHFASGLLSNLLDCMVSKLQAFYEYQKTMNGSAFSQIFTNVIFPGHR